MDAIYLISLLVGGFFVLLSLFGGGDTEADADTDGHFEAQADTDTDHDLSGHAPDAGPGLVDLLSIRALFLFLAFFGMTGLLLSWIDAGAIFTPVASVLTGLVVGLGGNYVIHRVGYEHVSSDVAVDALKGKTGVVVIPFAGSEKGKIRLEAKGQRLQLMARPFGDVADETFKPGDEVVVIRMKQGIAEVVKPA